MYSHDKYYSRLQVILKVLNQIRLYNVKGVKGMLYRYFSKKAISHYKPLSTEEMQDLRGGVNNIIVSFTSYGKRILSVHRMLDSIFLQTVKPEKVILWLSEEEYNGDINALTPELRERAANIAWFEIRFCEDLKPHKKYFETMKAYPNATVVTADDDVFYPSDWLEELIITSLSHPRCICCTTAHYITRDKNGNINRYSDWIHLSEESRPSMYLCPIGVGGVLYPPQSLHDDVFNKDFILNNCLCADDLWLKTMSLINNTMVCKSKRYTYTFLSITDSDDDSLSRTNVLQNENDEQLKRIMEKYGEKVKGIFS